MPMEDAMDMYKKRCMTVGTLSKFVSNKFKNSQISSFLHISTLGKQDEREGLRAAQTLFGQVRTDGRPKNCGVYP